MAAAAPSVSSSLPDRIVDAAERVVVEIGAANLTLEAVARAAGVSKGGLLYHFPSKEALLQGMVERYLRKIDAEIIGLVGERSSVAERLRARVRLRLELEPERRAVGAALIAASAVNPALMTSCRTRYREVADELSQLPRGFEPAALVLLAVDGLLLGELLHISPYTPTERARLAAALRTAIDQALAEGSR